MAFTGRKIIQYFMNIQHIVFDFGGVLVDWNPRYLYRNVFSSNDEMEDFLANICTDEWNLEQDRGRPLAEGTRLLQEQFPGYHDLIGLFYGEWEQMLQGDIPENVSALLQLKEKYPVYGLTNWSAETFPVALRRFSFLEVFDGIVVSGEEKMIKPDKQFFQLLLDRYQVAAGQSLFIDDNPKNIKAAQELGFKTIHIDGTINLHKELQRIGLLP
jgi:2-haloacid dehalogenase